MAMDVGFCDPLADWFERIEQDATSILEVSISFMEEVSPEPDLCNGPIQTLLVSSNRRFMGSRLCMTDDWSEFATAFNVVVMLVACCSLQSGRIQREAIGNIKAKKINIARVVLSHPRSDGSNGSQVPI
jgi:hypothetical protein